MLLAPYTPDLNLFWNLQQIQTEVDKDIGGDSRLCATNADTLSSIFASLKVAYLSFADRGWSATEDCIQAQLDHDGALLWPSWLLDIQSAEECKLGYSTRIVLKLAQM